MEIILGSHSPRRKEILEYFSLPFKQVSSSFDENKVIFSGDPEKFVLEAARGKAEALGNLCKDRIILTADTVVHSGKKLYLKPKSDQEAFQMLSELSGNVAEIYTGVCVKSGEKVCANAEETKVFFQNLDENQIRLYHRFFQTKDKAGAFYVQKAGSIIIKRIEGCFYNVMGLPIQTLRELLHEVDINLWDYIKK